MGAANILQHGRILPGSRKAKHFYNKTFSMYAKEDIQRVIWAFFSSRGANVATCRALTKLKCPRADNRDVEITETTPVGRTLDRDMLLKVDRAIRCMGLQCMTSYGPAEVEVVREVCGNDASD